MSFMRKFVPYFVLHLNNYKLHPREILSFIKNLKWRKGKKERLDIKSSSRVPPGSSVRFVFSPPDLAHYNTCCWTKSKGAEAGQVSLNIPVTLPLSHVHSWMWGRLGQLNWCTLLGVPLGYAQSRHSVEVSKLLGFFPPCSHWATSVLSTVWGCGGGWPVTPSISVTWGEVALSVEPFLNLVWLSIGLVGSCHLLLQNFWKGWVLSGHFDSLWEAPVTLAQFGARDLCFSTFSLYQMAFHCQQMIFLLFM